jgi:integrase
VEAKMAAHAEAGTVDEGPLTLARYAKKWIEERRALVDDWQNDDGRLRDHVLPSLGQRRVDEIRARDLADLFKKIRINGKLAPKTIYNIYSVLKALFRDAQLAELIDASPCVLTKYQLGENVDKDPSWRPTAVYSRNELEALISGPRIPASSSRSPVR